MFPKLIIFVVKFKFNDGYIYDVFNNDKNVRMKKNDIFVVLYI